MIVLSRGCPMQCSYCSVSSLSSHVPFRQRSVENVLKEIKDQQKREDIGFIDFEDENLCLNTEWFLSLFSKIKQVFKGDNIELRAMNGLYPPSIDEDIVTIDRKAVFEKLLQYFLYDGKIRGADSDGQIYEHIIDPDLTRQFIKRITDIKVVGTKSNAI